MPPQVAPGALALARRVFLVLLLIAELVGLTLRFDAASLAGTPGWSAAALAHARFVPEILLATVAAFVVVAAGRLKTTTAGFLDGPAIHIGWWRFGALHLAAYAGLFAFTASIFEGDAFRNSELPSLWFLAWAGLAAATLLFWAAAVAPPRSWRRFARRESVALALSFCVGFTAWCASRASQALWAPLGDGTFVLVEWLLRVIYSDVVSHPTDSVLGVRRFSVQISPSCSGYEGIGMVAVFLAAFMWTFRKRLRFPQAYLLAPVGLVGIWLANVLRITVLIILGTEWSRDVAVGGFHSQAGWIAFNLLALGLVATALRLPFFSRGEPSVSRPVPDRTDELPAYLVPFLAIIATSMVAGAFQPSGLDRLYPLKVLAALAAFWCYRGVYRRLDWSWSWMAIGAGIAVFLIWIGLASMDQGRPATMLADQLSKLSPGWRAVWLSFRVFGSVLTVPIAEELAFRGYLLRWSSRVEFEDRPYARCSWFSIAASSVLFGLMHARWLAGTLAGLAYALVVRRRGRLCDAILAHAVTNALIAADALLFDAWWLWE